MAQILNHLLNGCGEVWDVLGGKSVARSFFPPASESHRSTALAPRFKSGFGHALTQTAFFQEGRFQLLQLPVQ